MKCDMRHRSNATLLLHTTVPRCKLISFEMTQGKYRHYCQNPNGYWVFGGSTSAGGVWTATTYGSNLFRGFKGVAKDAGTSTADIIMYYYR